MKKHIKTIVAVFAAVCVIAGIIPFSNVFGNSLDGIVVASGSDNLFENGGFESSDTIGSTSPNKTNTFLTAGWQTNSVTNVEFAVSKDANSGKKALSIKHIGDGSYILRPIKADNSGIITGLDSGVYSLSLYAKGSAALQIRYRDAAVSELTDKSIILTDSYQKYTIDALVVGNTGNLIVELYSAASTGEIVIDDISLNKLPGVLNGDFESETGIIVPDVLNDFGPGINSGYSYLNANNMLSNGNFEDSTISTAVTEDYGEFTEGWVVLNKDNDDHKTLKITNDSHSGKKALAVTFSTNNTDEARIQNTACGDFSVGKFFGTNTTNLRYGYFSELSNEPYVISYWVKGNAYTRLMYAVPNGGVNRIDGKNYTTPEKWDEWELVTLTVSPDAFGTIWWNILLPAQNSSETAIIDDVQMMTLAQATQNVEAMIDTLDMNSANAERMVADIEQWASKLGEGNISNYSDFVAKKGGIVEKTYGNILKNSGFEKSTFLNNPAKLSSWNEFTNYWQSSGEIRNTKNILTLSSDAHSGSKALKIQGTENATTIRLYGTNANTDDGTYIGLDNVPYVFSYWVKGTAKTAVYYKDPPTAGAKTTGSTGTYYAETDKQDKWELVTKVLTPVNGVIWCNAFYNDTTKDSYAIFDDIMLMKVTNAEKMVIDMIDNLDLTSATAAQDIDNITQWCAKLGTTNITNYNKFVDLTTPYSYKDTGNIFNNPGFEASTVVNSATKFAKWNELTSGWASSSDIWNARLEVKITNDSHSGNNALSIKRLADNTVNGSPVNLYNLAAVKNSLSAVDTSGALRDGTITGLTSGTQYIYSFWVKGNAISRLQYRGSASDSAHTVASTNYSNTATQDEWELVHVKITADAAGIWANTFFQSDKDANINVTPGDKIIVDDIQLVTVAQAISNVESMITSLDVNGANTERLVADIEQWVEALGQSNISNYNDFIAKKNGTQAGGNLLNNPGFEESNEARNEAKLGVDETDENGVIKDITKEWYTTLELRQERTYLSIVNDSHSGNNAFKIERTNTDSASAVRMYNSVSADHNLYSVAPNTDYLVSYWVKGTAKTAVGYYSNPSAGSGFSTKGSTAVNWEDPGAQNKWELVTKVLTSDASGNIRFHIHFDNADKNVYAIIDDVQLIKLSEADALVIKMIDELDITASSAARDINDIEQWIAKLGDTNITNTDKFAEKKQAFADANNNSKWQAINGVHNWVTDNQNMVAIDNTDVAYGDKALSITPVGNIVTVKPDKAPFGFTNGYYMLVLWAKGSGEMKITANISDGSSENPFVKTEQLSANWTKYIYKDIEVSEGFSVTDFDISFSDNAKIDAVQMYRQIGPGTALDGVYEEIVDNKLSLIGAPDGYKLNIDDCSQKDILALDGTIATPKFNTNVEYTYTVENLNDDTDKAFRTVTLKVLGTDGERPAEIVPSDFAIRTLTDSENGVSVTGNLTSKAQLEVIPLDENSQYYSTLLLDEYDVQKFYNIFVIPASAVEGDLTFTFDVDAKYNGQTIIVSYYDKIERSAKETSVVVSDGKVTVTVARDGAFMLLTKKEKKAETLTPEPSVPSAPDNAKPNEDKNTETDKKPQNNNTENITTDNEKGSSFGWLLWLIIGIGGIVLLLLLLLTLVILVLRKRREEDDSEDDEFSADSE